MFPNTIYSLTLLYVAVYNNLCMCLLQQQDSKPERIKELAEVGGAMSPKE